MTDDDVTDGETTGRETRDADLRRRLRSAAHAHRPDRERMLARVERGMAARDGARAPRPRLARRVRGGGASWLRVAGTTAAVAGVFAAGGYGVATAVRGDDPVARTVATTPTAPPAASAPAPPTGPPAASAPPPAAPDRTKRPPRRPASGSPPTTRPPRPPASATPPRTASRGVLVRASGRIDPGSNPYWSQSDLTVHARRPLTTLTVELRVARSDEVADTGSWRSLPAEDFTVSVHERDGFLVYRWTLRAGRTVPAGRHVFAGQYNHPAGERDARDDTYVISSGAAGQRETWKGDVEPAAK
ncbi:hypothetical protein ACIG3E_26490 [Streptomyces sp. NPDC053474]|uniref:hypothetical protein n=1 Tax=Streptomyces sp. NPDC053474 TaxID=3365704 RepID=UPI0037D78F89